MLQALLLSTSCVYGNQGLEKLSNQGHIATKWLLSDLNMNPYTLQASLLTNIISLFFFNQNQIEKYWLLYSLLNI